ncbi:MAG: SPFH/Band 7/PHB domain protein [candidate division WOR-3 bacterium]|jgi:regulator of protease activity HflC (stomatin/prohibitin superfamily)|nr:SPFH/Band 7/PHB domain protein [candidate division WOR-3 bacterium]MCR4424388.1 SPFH/Band 7/PHB domain protein [candidate division WOR-3 bacterium]MDH7518206.1 SPFH domain-containing protein [bacterium]
MMPVLVIIVLIFLFIWALLGLKIVRPYQRGAVERLGKYQRMVQPGLNFIIPFLERLIKVDMREQVVDVPPQEVITKDNATVTVDAIVYYEVTDPVKVLYNVANFRLATIKLAQTNLRNVIGDLTLDESLTSRERINAKLRDVLDEATDKWGAKVTRVELQRIEPPSDVTEAMHRQMKAERDRRAVVLEAEGIRQAAILKAEGEKQARILEAEGQAGAIERVANAEKYKLLTVAEGEAQAIERVYAAIHKGNPTKDLIAIKYLEALAKMAEGKATKMFIPYEASAIMSAVAMIAEALKDKTEAEKK